MIKTLKILGIEGNWFNILKALYKSSQLTSHSIVKD